MTKEARAIDRLARIYAVKFEARAVILVGNQISAAVGAGRWRDVRRWQCVRSQIWAQHGATI